MNRTLKARQVFIGVGLMIAIAIVWIGFSAFNGKYDTLAEGLRKGVPYDVKDVVHTHKADDVTVVFYLTEPDPKDLPSADYDALGVAFFSGSDQEGWEHIGPNGWTHVANDDMTVYYQSLPSSVQQGSEREELYVVYGEINNSLIQKIETKSLQAGSYREANIIEKNGQRYYYTIGDERVVRGLSETGEVISQQGGE